MTAELQDERLAEMIANEATDYDAENNADVYVALRAYQAYRAKRETHVWVPRSLLTEGVSLCEEIVEECYEYTLEDRPLLGVGVDEYREKLLAASDGNPP